MVNDYDPNHIGEKTFARIGVKAIITNPDGHILLLKRSNKMRRSAGKWSIPGGNVEQFENPKDSLVREILEETQLTVTDIHPFETTGHEYDEDFVVVIGYTCKALNTNIILNWEHDEYVWVTKEKALEMDLSVIVRFFIKNYYSAN